MGKLICCRQVFIFIYKHMILQEIFLKKIIKKEYFPVQLRNGFIAVCAFQIRKYGRKCVF